MNRAVWSGKKPASDDNNNSKSNVSYSGNHMYFYSDITPDSVLEFRQTLNEITNDQNKMRIDFPNYEPKIILHINSDGGYVTDALNAMDCIEKNSIPIETIVEGISASGATLISVAGHHRKIQTNSVMLFHQIRGGFWGTHAEGKDCMDNWNLLAEKILDFYLRRSIICKKDLLSMLKDEKIIDAKQALKYGFVDEII